MSWFLAPVHLLGSSHCVLRVILCRVTSLVPAFFNDIYENPDQVSLSSLLA